MQLTRIRFQRCLINSSVGRCMGPNCGRVDLISVLQQSTSNYRQRLQATQKLIGPINTRGLEERVLRFFNAISPYVFRKCSMECKTVRSS